MQIFINADETKMILCDETGIEVFSRLTDETDREENPQQEHRKRGRPSKQDVTITTEQELEIWDIYKNAEMSPSDICKKYGISLKKLEEILKSFQQ